MSMTANIPNETIDLDRPALETPSTPPKDVDVRVGQNLRSARNLRGLTQKQLGETVSLTLQQIQKYENGSNRITVSRIHQFSEVLNVPVSHFFSGPLSDAMPGESADAGRSEKAMGLQFSADDFEILSLTQKLTPRLKRRMICLMEEIAERPADASEPDQVAA